jgi:hypothetical protein
MYQSIDDLRKQKKKRKQTISALVAAAILIVSGFIIRAKLHSMNADENFDYYDNPHDTELGAAM